MGCRSQWPEALSLCHSFLKFEDQQKAMQNTPKALFVEEECGRIGKTVTQIIIIIIVIIVLVVVVIVRVCIALLSSVDR